MEYTEPQKAAFKEQFGLRRKRQIVMAIPLIGLIIAFSVLADKKADSVLGVPIAVAGPAFVAIVLGMLVFSFRNWRCPACDGYLGKGSAPGSARSAAWHSSRPTTKVERMAADIARTGRSRSA